MGSQIILEHIRYISVGGILRVALPVVIMAQLRVADLIALLVEEQLLGATRGRKAILQIVIPSISHHIIELIFIVSNASPVVIMTDVRVALVVADPIEQLLQVAPSL